MSQTRVVLADDQVLFVDSLKTVLEFAAEDIVVAGIALNGKEAVELVREQRPDVVLMDVRMPQMDGVEATRMIRREFPDIGVVMLTTFDDDEYVFSALEYGARGYLLKDIPTDELVASIRAIRTGTMQISPSVVRKLIRRGGEGVEPPVDRGPQGDGSRQVDGGGGSDALPDASTDWLDRLSLRERDILSLLKKGYYNKQIADELSISEQTVKNHLSTIYRKMGVHSRLQALQLLASVGHDT
jgi:DNA-binding NarL/FixJ family response regulator